MQEREERRQRLAPGHAAERLHHRTAQQLAPQQLEQGGRGAGVAQLAQRVDRRILQPGLALQHAHERHHRLRGADLPQAGRGGVADVHVDVVQGQDEGGHRVRVAHGAEHDRREVADLLVFVLEQLEQVGDAGLAQLDVDLHRRVAQGGVFAVAQRALEGGQQHLGIELREVIGRRLPHRPALVGHRGEQGRDGLRTARLPESVDHLPADGLLAGAERLQGGLEVQGHCNRNTEISFARFSAWVARFCVALDICSTVDRLSRAISEMFSIAFTTSSPPRFCSAVA